MEFLFYLLIIVMLIVVFVNFSSLGNQISALRHQLTELQKSVLSLSEHLYQQKSSSSGSDTVQETTDQTLDELTIQSKQHDSDTENTNQQFDYQTHAVTQESEDADLLITEPPPQIPCAANNYNLNADCLQLNDQSEPVLFTQSDQFAHNPLDDKNVDFDTLTQAHTSYEEVATEQEAQTCASESVSDEGTEPEITSSAELVSPTLDPFDSAYKKVTTTSTGPNLWALAFNWFVKGNVLAKIAIAILFLGLTYLFKYSVEHDVLSPELRVLGALVLGVALLAVGWKLKDKRKIYALILQGGGFATLYLTIFAAYRLYELVPMLLAFAILFVICSTSVVFAVAQRAMSLAIIACVGGYLTPILLSNDSGNHVALFSYYLMVSSAILVISISQSWRVLNLLGFLFTFVVSLLWGMSDFLPEFYIECQIFIVANMLIYGILAVLLSIRSNNKEPYQNVIDRILLFGTPLSGFGLQYAITQQWEFGPAFSSLGFGLFYLIGSYIILRLWTTTAKKIALLGLAIGIAFSTLSIPLAFSANLTATLWLFEGTALSWIMLSQKYYRVALLGVAITVLGMISTCISLEYDHLTTASFVSLLGITSIILFINACLWHCYDRNDDIDKLTKTLFMVIASIAWILWILVCIPLMLDENTPNVAPILLGFTVSTWLWYAVGQKIKWNIIRYAVLALWLVIPLSLLRAHTGYYYLSSFGVWNLVWVLAFVSCYYYLHVAYNLIKNNHIKIDGKTICPLSIVLHISLFWMILCWLIRETVHWFDSLPWGYEVVKWSIATTIASSIILLFYFLIKRQIMTSLPLIKSYWMTGLIPIVLYISYYLIVGLSMSGQIIYWQYIPILNPLEESAIFGLIMLTVWLKFAISYSHIGNKIINTSYFNIPLPNMVLVLLITLTFLWSNSIVLRYLSQTFDISWMAYSLWHNNIVQMTASLLWMLTSVILITIGHRYSLRKVWYSGEIIQMIVIIKLIFVDIRELDGLLRAFAFIGVALLMLLIAYLAPLPPKQDNNKQILA
ncbi:MULTISPECIES: DUF2339 domain-containing protein [unclassified Gilliamella]|uniref:DUF2339 domain-containing protein n=1 Tax=unclassified Gilliamella TaxID=2685620 RepID=UPI00132138B1|nr:MULTISPECIES: DUF2339 domain-containing protein [unclassified Gilliamella]MWN31989.1 DUF2339 domain-containing protein [Gilliamella sp. Pra-s60]MWP29248.1 DUF2339 domain-containing protein [Gilliamella sp. Pra-s54]